MTIAEDIIDGICCALCARFFVDKNENLFEHGYPVVCDDCYTPDCGYEKALTKTL